MIFGNLIIYLCLLSFSALFFYPLVVGIISFHSEVEQGVIVSSVCCGLVFNAILFLFTCQTLASSKLFKNNRKVNTIITITKVAFIFFLYVFFVKFISTTTGAAAFTLGVVNIALTIFGLVVTDRL